jgi:hypothetical protein
VFMVYEYIVLFMLLCTLVGKVVNNVEGR